MQHGLTYFAIILIGAIAYRSSAPSSDRLIGQTPLNTGEPVLKRWNSLENFLL
ncbi:MAG: hypothetical protein AB1861_18225 [Cyanobacteriota bacterium]